MDLGVSIPTAEDQILPPARLKQPQRQSEALVTSSAGSGHNNNEGIMVNTHGGKM